MVTATDIGAQDFIDAVWPGGDVYIDEAEAFKLALGSATYRTWWLLRPAVVKDILSFSRRFGFSSADVSDKKTQLLGGTLVIKNGEVVYTHRETTTFDNGSVDSLLAAVKSACSSTPSQREAIAAE